MRDQEAGETAEQVLARLLTQLAHLTPADVSVPDALEFRREAYGLTAGQFAAVLGIDKSHYSEVIKGNRTLPIRATRRAFAVGVPAHVLLQIRKK